MTEPPLSVLIVNWNTRDDLRRCLAALTRSITAPHETIVVDNGSTDGSAELVRRDFPEVALIVNTHNVGYAAGNNQAFKRSQGPFLLLLNPDVELTAENVRALFDHFSGHAETAAACPRLVSTDGSTQYGYHRRHLTFPRLLASTLHTYGIWTNNRLARDYLMLDNTFGNPQPVEHPAAACLLIRRSTIEAAGGLFDERLPIFLNDVELSLRLRDAGLRVELVPTSVRHAKSQSTDRLDPYLNRELFFRSILTIFRLHRRWTDYLLAKAALLIVLPSVLLITVLGVTRRYFLAPIVDRGESIRKQLRIIRSVLFEGPLPALPS